MTAIRPAGATLAATVGAAPGHGQPPGEGARAARLAMPATPPAVTAIGPDGSAGQRLAGVLVVGGANGVHLPVELRVALVLPSAAAEPGLLARVSHGTALSGLILTVGTHRLLLPPGALDLPQGMALRVQLQPLDALPPADDAAALERLVEALRRRSQQTGSAAAPLARPYPAPDAALAARLLAWWQGLAETPAREAADGGERPVAVQADGESGRVTVADRETGWRALFGLLADAGGPAEALVVWRRLRERDGAVPESAERLVVVLELSRLGRVTIDLRVDDHRLNTVVTSAAPLPAPARTAIGEVYAAAVELADRSGALAFRVAMPPTVAPGRGALGGLEA